MKKRFKVNNSLGLFFGHLILAVTRPVQRLVNIDMDSWRHDSQDVKSVFAKTEEHLSVLEVPFNL